MSKRRLTKRQISRISAKQTKANAALGNEEIENADLESERSGFVVSHFGTQVLVQASDFSPLRQRCYFRANTAALVVGDEVRWQPGTSFGVINSRLPRRNVLERPGHRGIPKAIVANIDLLAVVFTSAPEAHRNLIDRYLVAAYYYDMQPLLIANKADIPTEQRADLIEICKDYRKLGYQVIEVSTKKDIGIDELKAAISNKTLMFAGQSGVGKSSITNVLVPDANMQIGELSHAADKGKHTTTSSHWFAMECGGGLIDSPGIREFGINHLDKGSILAGFIDCKEHVADCLFRDCNHRNDKGCALLAAYENNKISDERFQSFQLLYQEAEMPVQ